MIKKFVMNADFSKVFSPDCIAVGVLKNCKPELSYKLVELCDECLKKSFFCRLLKGFVGGPCI